MFNVMIKVSMLGTMCHHMSNLSQMLQTPRLSIRVLLLSTAQLESCLVLAKALEQQTVTYGAPSILPVPKDVKLVPIITLQTSKLKETRLPFPTNMLIKLSKETTNDPPHTLFK